MLSQGGQIVGLVCLMCFAGCLAETSSTLAGIPSISSDIAQKFENFLKEHKIPLSGAAEKAKRLNIFNNNLATVNRLNKEKKHGSAVFGINKFSHLSSEEFSKTMLMTVDFNSILKQQKVSDLFSVPNTQASNILNRKKRSASNVPPNNPTSYDWRDYNKVTPVKDQGSCGDCYSFATVANVESLVAISGGGLLDLSEQELTSCDPNQGKCNGGSTISALKYIQANGVHYESAAPYVANSTYNGTCPTTWNSSQKVFINGIFSAVPGNEDNLAAWLVRNGPFTVGWGAASDFQHYVSGIYSNANCPSTNHALLIVGYGTNANGSYWIAKNSWGTGFGEAGYVLIQRGVNTCSVASYIQSGIIGTPNLSNDVASPQNCTINYTDGTSASMASGCQFCNGQSKVRTCWNGGWSELYCPNGATCQSTGTCAASCVGPSTTPSPTTTAASCTLSPGNTLPSGCQFCNGAAGNTTVVATCSNGNFQVNDCPNGGAAGNTTVVATCSNGNFQVNDCPNGGICYGNGQCAITCGPPTTTSKPTTQAPTTTAAVTTCTVSVNGQPQQVPAGCQFCNGAAGNVTQVATCMNGGGFQLANCPNAGICYGNGQCAISCH
ncbi:papain family cysteine protease domain-containing protein [Ditylenchus destructor]|nr:papain family cysteine protease domain-containing protein [Ditylenchus destructor]